MAWKRKERMMREKGETWKHHQEFSGDKKRKKKSMFHFSPLFGFIFLVWPFTTGEGGKGWDAARRRVGKGKRKKSLTSSRIVNTWRVKTHLILWQNRFEQHYILNSIQPSCKNLRSDNSIMCLMSSLPVFTSANFPVLIFWATSAFYSIFKWGILLNGHHTSRLLKSTKVVLGDRRLSFFQSAGAGSDFSESW